MSESEKLVQALAMWRDPNPVIEGPALRFTSTEHGRAALLTLHPDSELIDALTTEHQAAQLAAQGAAA